MSGRKLARRACDGCKIRKIKCSEASPCNGCTNAGIPCTWLKQAQPRGPRRLRDATLQEIRKAQDILQTQSQEAVHRGTSRSANVNDPDPPPQPSSEIAQLVLYLCVYRVQLYPIWPVIKVERLIASLQSESPDVEVFALAYALAAATAARTQSTDLSISRRNHAQILIEKCQTARSKVPQGRSPNLTTVRIAFFLHIYYESLEANSMKSMLYLREAVTIATMIGMHKESYYLEVPVQEREIRRRVLWLLFVTERVISILYEQPVTLKTRIELPSIADTDEIDILAGFQLLVKLFWRLDDGSFFSFLDELDIQASPPSNGTSGTFRALLDYAVLIQDMPHIGYIPPVQALGLAITRSWLQIMNLRLQQAFAADTPNAIEHAILALLSSIEQMLDSLEKSSSALVEAHGSALQLKISALSGTLQELLSAPSGSISHPETYERCERLSATLEQALAGKVGKIISSKVSATSLMVRAGSHKAVSFSSPTGATPGHSFRGVTLSPNVYALSPGENANPSARGSRHVVVPPFPPQDFAISNNYEGLFEAVELAGVQSPDSVEGLFSNASLDHYSTFDDSWPIMSSPQHACTAPSYWHDPQKLLYEFG